MTLQQKATEDRNFVEKCYTRFEDIKSGKDEIWKLDTTETCDCWIPINQKSNLPATNDSGFIFRIRIYRAAYIAHIFHIKGVVSAVRVHRNTKKKVRHLCESTVCVNPEHLVFAKPKPPPKRSKRT